MTIFADIWGFLSLLVDHWRAFLIAGTLSGLGLISMILQARRHPILATVIGMTLLAIATVDLSGPTPDPAPTASAEMKATDPDGGIIRRGIASVNRGLDWAREVIDG